MRPNGTIPPSWLSPQDSPTSPWCSPVTHLPIHPGGIPPQDPPAVSGYKLSPASTFKDILSDNLFDTPNKDAGPSSFTSPKLSSGSPDLQSHALAESDPDKLAKQDPLATQVWKMFARTKAHLPHAQRMENLTWRMMALELRKKRVEDDEGKQLDATTDIVKIKDEVSTPSTLTEIISGEERGRSIAKGKGKVRVVGFDGTNQDGTEDDE